MDLFMFSYVYLVYRALYLRICDASNVIHALGGDVTMVVKRGELLKLSCDRRRCTLELMPVHLKTCRVFACGLDSYEAMADELSHVGMPS